jgi:hypothetical protein
MKEERAVALTGLSGIFSDLKPRSFFHSPRLQLKWERYVEKFEGHFGQTGMLFLEDVDCGERTHVADLLIRTVRAKFKKLNKHEGAFRELNSGPLAP